MSARWVFGQHQEGGGRQERGRRPIHARAGRVARRNPPPTARSMARAASRPPRRLAGRPERERPNKSERSQSERADVHGSGVGAFSHVQRGAPRCTTTTNSAATCARLFRATRRLVRNAEIHHPHSTSACLRAPCVRCVHARCGVRSGEARRLCVLRACASVPIRVCPGAGKANEAQGPTTQLQLRSHMRACTCVRSTQPQEARLERPSSPTRSRPASSEQAHRASSVGSHLEGGRGGAPSLHLHRLITTCLITLDCV